MPFIPYPKETLEEKPIGHKIIDAADLEKILMNMNFYPDIVRREIELCPALDLFEEDKK